MLKGFTNVDSGNQLSAEAFAASVAAHGGLPGPVPVTHGTFVPGLIGPCSVPSSQSGQHFEMDLRLIASHALVLSLTKFLWPVF